MGKIEPIRNYGIFPVNEPKTPYFQWHKYRFPFGRILAIFALAVLTACTTPSGSWCDIARPQRPSQAEIDAMSDARVAEVLAWNRKGERLCSWRP